MGNLLHKHGEVHKALDHDLLVRCRTITRFSDDEILNEYNKFFSVTESGHLKKSHMEELLGDYIPSSKHKHIRYLTNCIFSAIDTNNDGYIDFLEYLISIKFFRTESPVEKADFVFRIIDENGDRHLTKKEIERILKCLEEYHKTSLDIHVTSLMNTGVKSVASAIVEKLDDNHSGSIGISEFIDGWLKDETIRALFTF